MGHYLDVRRRGSASGWGGSSVIYGVASRRSDYLFIVVSFHLEFFLKSFFFHYSFSPSLPFVLDSFQGVLLAILQYVLFCRAPASKTALRRICLRFHQKPDISAS